MPRKYSLFGGAVFVFVSVSTPIFAQEAEELWQADGFAMPESVLWDAGTGAPLRTIKELADRVSLAAFSPDGKQIAASSPDLRT